MLGFSLIAVLLKTRQMQMTDRAAIRSVIERQIQAFQKDDAEEAFTLASPGIQEKFGTPETFMEMVKTAYKPVYRPRSVVFEALKTWQGSPAQPVLLLGPNGVPIRAIYIMAKQPDGDWRINGCYLVLVQGEMI